MGPAGTVLGVFVTEGLSYFGEWLADYYLASMTAEQETLLDQFVYKRYGALD